MSGVAYHRAAALSLAASSCLTASTALEADQKDLHPWGRDAFVPLQHVGRRAAPLLVVAAVVAAGAVAVAASITVKAPFPATAVGASGTSHAAAWKNTLMMEPRTAYQLVRA